MKRIITAIKRAALLIKMRALEITLHGQNLALQTIFDMKTRERIQAARMVTSWELAKAYIDFRATLPAHRRTWRAV